MCKKRIRIFVLCYINSSDEFEPRHDEIENSLSLGYSTTDPYYIIRYV